jgi:hypothetical protein
MKVRLSHGLSLRFVIRRLNVILVLSSSMVKGLVPLYKRRQVTKLREPIVLLRFRRSAHPSLTTCGVLMAYLTLLASIPQTMSISISFR